VVLIALCLSSLSPLLYPITSQFVVSLHILLHIAEDLGLNCLELSNLATASVSSTMSPSLSNFFLYLVSDLWTLGYWTSYFYFISESILSITLMSWSHSFSLLASSYNSLPYIFFFFFFKLWKFSLFPYDELLARPIEIHISVLLELHCISYPKWKKKFHLNCIVAFPLPFFFTENSECWFHRVCTQIRVKSK